MVVSAAGGTSLFNAFGVVPNVTGPVYFSLQAEGLDASTSVLVVQEGDVDIDLVDGVAIAMGRSGGNGCYFRHHVPNTSSYRWMRITLRAYPTGKLLIKVGRRPTEKDYDWIWEYPRHAEGSNTLTRHLYISAQDDAFNAGYFYFWYTYSTSHVLQVQEDHLRVSMETWAPRRI